MNVEAQGDFTRDLWNASSCIFQQILTCRFVVGLADASLQKAHFARYLSQDVLYLQRDNEALELMSQRTDKEDEKAFFRQLADDGIAMEQAMHDDYLTYFNVGEAKTPTPIFGAYGRYLVDSAKHAPYPVALAALLPCFWLYGEMGKHIAAHQVPYNPYQKFIDAYVDEFYDRVTIRFIKLVEEYSRLADEQTKQAMKEAFLKSSQFEYQVFEEAVLLY